MPYQSFFASKPSSAPTTQPNGASGYKSYFGTATIAQPSSQEIAASQKPAAPATKPASQPAPPKGQSLFSKAKAAGKQMVTDAVHIGEKSANTVTAGVGGTVGAGVAAVQAATGHKDAAQKTVASTSKTMDALLGHGVGNQGGYISAKDAAGSSPKAVIKGIAKGATDIAPFAVPGAKGGSLLSKVARDAVANGIVGAGGTAAQEKLGGQNLSAKEIAKGGAVNAAFAVGVHGLTAGAKGVAGKFSKGKDIPALPTEPSTTHTTPQPGDIIQPDYIHTDVATPQHAKVVDDLIQRATTENPVFQQNMSGVAKDLGLKYTPGPVKDGPRALVKVVEDYHGNHNALKDTIRGTMEVPDHSKAGFQKAIDAIQEKYPGATVKDGYKNYKNGYADVKVNVKTPSGHQGEIILATPEMLQAKNKLGGHELYEIARDSSKTPEQKKAAVGQMNTLYGNAHDAANRRLASESDKPNSETRTLTASSGETGSPAPYGKTPTSLDLPDKTLVSDKSPEGSSRTANTTSSSVTKNLTGEGDVSIPSTIAKDGEKVKDKQNSPQMVDNPPLKPFETAHMEPVDGYTHSTHMETDFATMLRETEQGLKGGETIKNPDGTYRRTSEHSRFYRDYYKEHGKAPTKDAWLQEARRQLSSGKAPYGASDSYKALLERENRPIPTMEVKTSPTKPKVDVKHTEGVSRVYERLQAEQPEVLKGDVTYKGVNLKQEAAKAVKLVESDKNKAYRVAMGHEPSPDVTATSVNIALAEKALQDGNHSLYAQLVKNRSLRLTRAGQEIVAEKGSVSDNSTSRYVKELVNARLGKLGNGYLGDIKTKVGTSSTKERAITRIDREVAKAQKKITGKQLDLKSAQDLIDKLAC